MKTLHTLTNRQLDKLQDRIIARHPLAGSVLLAQVCRRGAPKLARATGIYGRIAIERKRRLTQPANTGYGW